MFSYKMMEIQVTCFLFKKISSQIIQKLRRKNSNNEHQSQHYIWHSSYSFHCHKNKGCHPSFTSLHWQNKQKSNLEMKTKSFGISKSQRSKQTSRFVSAHFLLISEDPRQTVGHSFSHKGWLSSSTAKVKGGERKHRLGLNTFTFKTVQFLDGLL